MPRGRIEGVVTAAAIAAVLVGLAALPAGAVSTTPKNGAWTGVGQDDMQIGFEVTHHRLEASWGPQTRIYVHYKTTTCSAAGTVNAPPVTPDADGRFTVTQGNDTVQGRFTSPTRVRGKFTHVQTTTCTPGTYVYKFVGRRFPK